MYAVVYDAGTGAILQTLSGSPDAIAADPRPHLAVDTWRDDYDTRYKVLKGALVALPVTAATPADVEATLIGTIDAQRELMQMAVLTTGSAKKYVYNRKAAEAIDSRSLLTAALNALSLTDKQRRFPFAQAEAAVTGETLSVVLARYEAALSTSAARIAAIEATAQKTKRAIRAATTVAAKQAAATATWP